MHSHVDNQESDRGGQAKAVIGCCSYGSGSAFDPSVPRLNYHRPRCPHLLGCNRSNSSFSYTSSIFRPI